MARAGSVAGAGGLIAAASAPAPRVGRDGALRLAFEGRDGRTFLARCRYTLPLQVLGPVALDDPAAVVSVLNPTGGLVGGDRLSIHVHARAGAHGCLTTPSATKVYRTAAGPAVQEVRLRLEGGAALEWVPDHAIPFAGSALRQTISAEVADDARLILIDAFAAGRIARGEAWRFALLDSAVSVRDERGWIFHDRFVLAPAAGGAPRWAALGLGEGHDYFASLVVVTGADRDDLGDLASAIGRHADGVTAGAAPLARRGLVVRCLARSAPALTTFLDAAWGLARRALLDLPPLALRKP